MNREQDLQNIYQRKLSKVYGVKTQAELAERYDQWASGYDADMTLLGRHELDEGSIQLVRRHVPQEAQIMDAGAGTGIYAQVLYDVGYHHFTGIDLSEGMLAEARKKGIYQELRQMVLGEPLDYPDHTFDAVISFGVFTAAHAPAHAFDELARITKPGGHIIFTMRTDFYTQPDFQQKFEEFNTSGIWTLIDTTQPYQPYGEGITDMALVAWAYRVGV